MLAGREWACESWSRSRNVVLSVLLTFGSGHVHMCTLCNLFVINICRICHLVDYVDGERNFPENSLLLCMHLVSENKHWNNLGHVDSSICCHFVVAEHRRVGTRKQYRLYSAIKYSQLQNL